MHFHLELVFTGKQFESMSKDEIGQMAVEFLEPNVQNNCVYDEKLPEDERYDDCICEECKKGMQLDHFYDWLEIGGRWTGAHDNYNAYDDERNLEKCSCCHGTGMRNDKLGKEHRLTDPKYKCNGCNGRGVSVKWSLEAHDGDVMEISKIDSACNPYHIIVVKDGECIEWKYENDKPLIQFLISKGITHGVSCTIDYNRLS